MNYVLYVPIITISINFIPKQIQIVWLSIATCQVLYML